MFLHPLGLLALAALPTVLFLHLFRRRFRPVRVSALFLWEALEASPAAGRRRERLLRSKSLWLELAAALCLALALAGPRGCSGGRAEHLVVVLDTSASMEALVDGLSFRERAALETTNRIRSLSGLSRVTLIASGRHPRVLSGPASFPAEALSALEEFRASAEKHDLEPALGLAIQLAGAGRVLLITDHYEPDNYPPSIGIVALGRPVENVGWISGRRSTTDTHGSDRVSLRAQNFGTKTQTRTVRISADSVLINERELALEPGEKSLLSFDIPASVGVVHASLTGDGLAIDDDLRLVASPPRTLGISSRLTPETANRLGIARGDDPLRRLLDAVPGTVAVPAGPESHLVLSGGSIEDETWALVVHAPGTERRDLVGPFLTEKRHPVLRGLTFEGTVWSASPGGVRGSPIVSSGDVPLLTEERDGAERQFFLNLDPARSTLQRSPDWPILLSNLLELRRRELPGPESTNVVIGEALRYRSSSPATYELRQPDASVRKIESREQLVVEDLTTPGLFVLSSEGRELATFALNFVDARESDLSGLRSGSRPANTDAATLEASFTWIEALLAAAALLFVCANWFVLTPRRPANG